MTRISRPSAFVLVLLFAAVPLRASAADTGGRSVTSSAPAPVPLTLGATPTAPTTPATPTIPATPATPTTPTTPVTPTTAPAASKVSAATGTKSVVALLKEARASIAGKKWTDTITTLQAAAAIEPSNADVQNLLGYSNRNNGDYPAALRYYAAALTINPNHTGALEYQGVAFLKLGLPAKAKANLARLKTICGASCGEYKDLAAALNAETGKKSVRLAKK